MNSTKKLTIIIGLVLFLFGLYSCDDPVSDEVGNSYQQEQIPWASLAGTPWPIERHDAQGTARSEYAGPSMPTTHISSGDSLYVEGTAVLGETNNLYFIGISEWTQNLLIKRDDSNLTLWSIDFGGSTLENSYSPTLADGNVIYTCDGISGTLAAVNSQDGSLLWAQVFSDYLRSGVSVDRDGNLYVVIGNQHSLKSLDPSGNIRWESPTSVQVHSFTKPPVIFSPTLDVMFCSGSDSVYSISLNGHVNWGYHTGSGYLNMMVDNSSNIYFFNPIDSSFTCLMPNGAVRWKTHMNECGLARVFEHEAPTIDYKGNVYYVVMGAEYELGVCSLSNTGEFRWLWTGFGGYQGATTPLTSDKNNAIYFGYSEDDIAHVFCISSEGLLNWEYSIQGFSHLRGEVVIRSDSKLVLTDQNTNANPIVIVGR